MTISQTITDEGIILYSVDGKFVGELTAGIYHSVRKPTEHYYKNGGGYSISEELLQELKKQGCVKIVIYEHGDRIIIYSAPLKDYLDCEIFQHPPHDEQRCLPIENMDKIITATKEELIKMNLKDTALAYEPPQTLNIADLDVVSVEVEVLEKEGKTSEGETFKYFYTIVDDKEYRIPKTVLDELKTILTLKPEIQKVNVTKTGSGLATRYKVNPL